MFEAMLTEEQRSLRNEVREFVRSVPRQLILDIDADRVQYPRDFAREAGRRNLLGLRFPLQYGGRGLRWEDEIFAIEEVAVLGDITQNTRTHRDQRPRRGPVNSRRQRSPLKRQQSKPRAWALPL